VWLYGRAWGDAAWAAAGCLTDLVAVLFQREDQGVDEVAESLAGHAGQLEVLQVVEREGARALGWPSALPGQAWSRLVLCGVKGVVPVSVEAAACDRQSGDSLIVDADTDGVLAAVEFGVHGQAGAAGRRCDRLEQDFMAGQGPAEPIHGDVGEQPCSILFHFEVPEAGDTR